MVAIAPFRALRYNLDVVRDLSRVIAPPYDVISADQQEQLHQASAYNIVRLIFGKQLPDDTPTSNRYTRARQFFDQWRHERVLIREETPAIYLVEHAFTWEGQPFRRLGFIALLPFQGSVPGQVYFHEATFEGPKADRALLLDAVRAHLSPVFCVVPDQEGQVHAMLSQYARSHEPLATAQIPAGLAGGLGPQPETLQLWAIQEPGTLDQLAQLLQAAKVLVADGHHRFAVAYAHRHFCPAVMSYFAWLEDPAVAVRPIHRVVRLSPEAHAQALARLSACCRLEQLAGPAQLFDWLAASSSPGRLGVYVNRQWQGVSVHPEVLSQWLAAPPVPSAIAGLDVTILHQLLLPRLSPERLEPQPDVRYTPHPEHAITMADQAPGSWAWFLRPIRVAEVFALAQQGHTLPQKSTYFYPKVLAGFVINPFDEA